LPTGTRLKAGTIETPWELIAAGGLVDTFGPENGKALRDGMKAVSYPRFRECVTSYQPPSSVPPDGWFQGHMILDIQSSTEGYEIVDATLGEASFGDAELEACLRASYKGVRVQLTTADPNMRYRLDYPVAFAFGAARESPPQSQPSEPASIPR
jgi:hypothetical protein